VSGRHLITGRITGAGRGSAQTRPTGAAAVNTAAIRVLPLRAEHLDAVLDIEQQVTPAGWTRKIFLSELQYPDSRCYLVAQLDRPAGAQVVAFAGMQLQMDEAHITTLAVDPSQRRRKLATRLLVVLLREARKRGARAATLEVRVHNAAAQRLYAGFGFRPVGVRPRYYEGQVDALIMWAHDIDGEEYGQRLQRLAERLTPAWDTWR
jgi:[ribosomal protein S18]-alanine N-acetyltransferase